MDNENYEPGPGDIGSEPAPEPQKTLDQTPKEPAPQEKTPEPPAPAAEKPKASNITLTVSRGVTIPGATQYSSQRYDYTLTATIEGNVNEARVYFENMIDTWLPKPPAVEASKPHSAPPPAAPKMQPFLEVVKAKVEAKLNAQQKGKVKFSMDKKGNVEVHPAAFLGNDFKPIADAVKGAGYQIDYVGEGSGKHWVIFNPDQSTPAAANEAPPQNIPDATLDPEKLDKLPWRPFHEGNPSGWVFVNAPGAEVLYAMLKDQRDAGNLEVPVLIGRTNYYCSIKKDKDKKDEDKFLTRNLTPQLKK